MRPVQKKLLFAIIPLLFLAVNALFLATTQIQKTTRTRSKAEETPRLSLRYFAEKKQFLIGTALNYPAFRIIQQYKTLVAQEFNSLTPEGTLQFKSLHPTRETYTFSPADAIIEFALAHNMQIHGHVLVYGTDKVLPEWLTQGNFSPDEIQTILRDHIDTVVKRYAGKIRVWDVVNEPFGDKGNLLQTFWYKALGPSYIEDAFRWAHEADPDAILILNENRHEGPGRKSDAVYNLLKSLKEKGVPIHGVGIQSHFSLDNPPNFQNIAANMARYAALGLDVYITEFDLRIKQPARPEDFVRQATIYRQYLETCLKASNCHSFTTWGFTDRHSWIPRYYIGYGTALFFDESYLPKPAYYAMLDVLNLQVNPHIACETGADCPRDYACYANQDTESVSKPYCHPQPVFNPVFPSPTPTQIPSPSATPTATPTPTSSPTPTVRPSPSHTPRLSPSPTRPPTPSPTPTPTSIPTPTPVLLSGDLDRDGDVDIFDYNLLVSDFGKTGTPGFASADIDRNGKVDIFDYNILVTNFGRHL